MVKLLLYAIWTVACLFLTGVIITADRRRPGDSSEYDSHADSYRYGPVQVTDWSNYIDRHNYGYVLRRVKDVHIATYHAKMIFHLQLPDWQIEFDDISHTCGQDLNITLGDCIRLRELLLAIRDIRDQTQVFIKRQVQRIHQVVVDLPLPIGCRPRRGFLTDVLSHVTGLATKDQLQAVVHVHRQVEKGIYESARVWGDGARSLTVAFKVQQGRMDNVFDILGVYRQSIRELQTQFINARRQHVAVSCQQASVMGQALHFLNNNTIQLLEIEALYNGIQSLMSGSISHYLLPHDHLARALLAVDQHLHEKQPHMILSRMDSAYYYNEAAFRTFRHLNTLFIALDAPVTTTNLRSRFQIYDLVPLPLHAHIGPITTVFWLLTYRL